MKRRRFYEKPSERANREQAEAIRRSRKAARKKAQREGLIAAPPGKKKVPPGRPTERGPFSVTGGVQRQPGWEGASVAMGNNEGVPRT
jgi:small subunit ribosomal protein S21